MSLTRLIIKEVITAEEDSIYEKKFALKLLNNKKEISDFEFYDDYKKSIKDESEYLSEPLLFVGGGAIPISPILISEHNINNITIMDIDEEAKIIGEKIIKKLKLNFDFIIDDAIKYNNYSKFNCIFIALEAGITINQKKEIFNNINKQISSKETVIVRSSKTDDFIDVSNIIYNYFKIIDEIDIFNGLSKSYICKKEII